MTSYLSIDLDYFACYHEDQDTWTAKIRLSRFMNKVLSLGVPIHTAITHEYILSDLNNYKVDKIYNIDYHSDLVYDIKYLGNKYKDVECEEWNWANYYKYSEDCIFEWRYPNYERCFQLGYGKCSYDLSMASPPWSVGKFPYKNSIHKKGTAGINFNSVVAVCICASPEWCDEWIYPYYKKFGIDYKEVI